MYKEKLIKYVQAKNEYIKKMTGINYVTIKDIDDIISWKEKDCKQIWQKLDPKNEIDGCPWCIKTYTKHSYLNCDACSYGNRNGECVGDVGRIAFIHDKAEDLGIDRILTSDEIVEAHNRINNED